MAKGGGKQNKTVQTQTVNTAPWGPAQGAIKTGLNQAQQLLQKGPQQYYPGDTYAGLGATTQGALSGITTQAQQPVPGLADAQSKVAGIASGATGLDASRYDALYDKALGPLAGSDQLSATAAGDYLGDANPYLSQLYSQGADDVTNQLKDLYSGIGRYGSSPMTQDVGKSLGNLYTSIYAPAYESERSRQLQAASQLGSNDLAGQNAALNAATAGTGVASQNIGNQLTAAQVIPGLNDASYDNLNRQLQAGLISDQDRQSQIDADKARFDFGQQAPQDLLSWYQSLVNGTGSLGGTQTGTSTTSEPAHPLLNILGTAASLAPLFFP